MNFKEWSDTEGKNLEFSEHRAAAKAWSACRDEILKIIFLNTKVNGIHTINVDKIISEIEKL